MFDNLKNLGNLGNLGELFSKAEQMQARMKQAHEELAKRQITADAGGGMVQATVNGRMELTNIKIDKTRMDLNDTELLEDVIVAAVTAAQGRAAQTVQEEMRKIAGEIGLPPGMLPSA
jgi:DNA-binding YbaB/EbfC family protein